MREMFLPPKWLLVLSISMAACVFLQELIKVIVPGERENSSALHANHVQTDRMERANVRNGARL